MERRQYFRTWTSYSIPMKPTDPINYPDTEQSRSYYMGVFNSSGHLIEFTKYFRKSKDIPVDQIESEIDISNNRYYKLVELEDNKYKILSEIEFPDTEDLELYARAVYDSEGVRLRILFISKEIEFIERYEYYVDGKLKVRTLVESNNDQNQEFYDERGRRVSSPLP